MNVEEKMEHRCKKCEREKYRFEHPNAPMKTNALVHTCNPYGRVMTLTEDVVEIEDANKPFQENEDVV